MSRTLALAILVGCAASAHAVATLPFDSHDTGNWIEVRYVEAEPTGVDWYYYNTFNNVRHSLADTEWRHWKRKLAPDVSPTSNVPTGLLFDEGGWRKLMDFSIHYDEISGLAPITVTVTIGALTTSPYGRPARELTISSIRGTRQEFGIISAPEPSSLALAGVGALALLRRRKK